MPRSDEVGTGDDIVSTPEAVADAFEKSEPHVARSDKGLSARTRLRGSDSVTTQSVMPVFSSREALAYLVENYFPEMLFRMFTIFLGRFQKRVIMYTRSLREWKLI